MWLFERAIFAPKNSLPYKPVLNKANPPSPSGVILPLNMPRMDSLPLTIRYNASHAKLNPLAFTGSPSYIIHAPKSDAPPNVKQDNRVGRATATLRPNLNALPVPPVAPTFTGVALVPNNPLRTRDPLMQQQE